MRGSAALGLHGTTQQVSAALGLHGTTQQASQPPLSLSLSLVLLPRPGLGMVGSECLHFHPHTNNPLLSMALNSLATPSSLTKTLKWLLFWLDCRYLKHLSTLLSVHVSFEFPLSAHSRKATAFNMGNTEHRRNTTSLWYLLDLGCSGSCHEQRLRHVGLKRHRLGLTGGSGQPEAMLPGDLPAVYSGLWAKALISAVT